MIFQLEDRRVRLLGNERFIAHNATIIGSVTIGQRCSIWYNAVIRGDYAPITIHEETNVQDAVVLHADPGFPLLIGRRVTVGHKAMLHGASIGECSLIGINAVVLNGASIGKECIVGANALVAEGKQIPDGSVVVGSPARVARRVTEKDLVMVEAFCEEYLEKIRRYSTTLKPDHGIHDSEITRVAE